MLRQHCTLAIDLADQLVAHYIPVVIDGVVYGNVFCAHCFGANIRQGQFWKLVLDGIRGLEEKCSDLRKNIPYKPVRWKLLTTYCIPKVTPWTSFLTFGSTRLGKLCLVPTARDYTNAEEKALNGICPGLMAVNLMPQMNSAASEIIAFAKIKDGFKAVANVKAICEKCDALALSLFALTPSAKRTYLLGKFGVGIDRTMIFFFNSELVFNCESEPRIPSMVHIVISLSGSILSLIVLTILLQRLKNFKKHVSKKPNRAQIFLIASKMLFLSMFIVSYFLRKIASKVMSALLHTSLFLSFSYYVLFGQKVSIMMWQLKKAKIIKNPLWKYQCIYISSSFY